MPDYKISWAHVQLPVVLIAYLSAGGQSVRGQSDVLHEMRALVDTVQVATWVQTSWERRDDKEERTAARCIWAGQDNMRLDVFEGRGTGATAILYGGRVHGFKRGLLSFIKRSFDPRHTRVLSLRGNSMTANGFMDDLAEVLTQPDRVTFDNHGPNTVILRYTDSQGLHSTLHVRRDPIRVLIHERSDRDGLVERYTYSDVLYNPEIDPELLKP